MKGQEAVNLRLRPHQTDIQGRGSLCGLHGLHCGENTEGLRDIPALRDRPPPPQHSCRAVQNTANSGAPLRARRPRVPKTRWGAGTAVERSPGGFMKTL